MATLGPEWIQPEGPNSKPRSARGQELLNPPHPGFEALRWAGDAPVWVAGEVPQIESSIWTCAYCGKVNPDSALVCGQGRWDGCGASRPDCDEPPRAILYLRNSKVSCDGGVAIRRLDGTVERL
jgi:hypothetical protein